MNLRQLEVFRAVMVTGTVSDAARLLHVSVPAVSRLLANTESRLGFTLFERVKGRLHPTTEARRLYQEVEQVHSSVLRISELAEELAQRRYGFVSIVSSPSIAQHIVPQAVARFHAAHPKVRVRFRAMSHQRLKEQVLAGFVDLGISTLPVEHPMLSTRAIARSRLMCVCHIDHPYASRASVTVADLLLDELIAYPRDTPLARRIDALFAACGQSPRTGIEVESPQNACALVHAGAGVALVDEFTLRGWRSADFRACSVEGAEPILADLVHLRSAPLTPAADAFIDTLRQVLALDGMLYDPPHPAALTQS